MARPWAAGEFEQWKQQVCNEIEKELNMTDPTSTTPVVEPAGVARFAAASFPNVPIKTAASDPPAPLTLEDRITELENVVHTLGLQVSGDHWKRGGWLERIGARIKATVGG